MRFKNFISIVIFALFMISCKTTSSSIVTSKKEAEKLGLYKTPKKILVSKPIENLEHFAIDTVGVKSPENAIIPEKEARVTQISSPYIAEQIITKAKQFEGVRYVYGGNDISGIDCSAFILACYNGYNIPLPRTSLEMSKLARQIDKLEAKKGDLIFFKTGGSPVVNHVGIVIDYPQDGEVTFMHASTHKGVTTSSTKEDYYNKAFAQIGRVLE